MRTTIEDLVRQARKKQPYWQRKTRDEIVAEALADLHRRLAPFRRPKAKDPTP